MKKKLADSPYMKAHNEVYRYGVFIGIVVILMGVIMSANYFLKNSNSTTQSQTMKGTTQNMLEVHRNQSTLGNTPYYQMSLPERYVHEVVTGSTMIDTMYYTVANKQELLAFGKKRNFQQEDFFMQFHVIDTNENKDNHTPLDENLRQYIQEKYDKTAFFTKEEMVNTDTWAVTKANTVINGEEKMIFLVPLGEESMILFLSNPHTENEKHALDIITSIQVVSSQKKSK